MVRYPHVEWSPLPEAMETGIVLSAMDHEFVGSWTPESHRLIPMIADKRLRRVNGVDECLPGMELWQIGEEMAEMDVITHTRSVSGEQRACCRGGGHHGSFIEYEREGLSRSRGS